MTKAVELAKDAVENFTGEQITLVYANDRLARAVQADIYRAANEAGMNGLIATFRKGNTVTLFNKQVPMAQRLADQLRMTLSEIRDKELYDECIKLLEEYDAKTKRG